MSVPADPLNFIPADLFFPTVPGFRKPRDVVSVESSQSIKPLDKLRYAAHITLAGVNGDSETHCLVQFVTPLIWRIRYDPKYTSLNDFDSTNTRTIVRDTFPELVDGLQHEYRDSDAWNSYPAKGEWYWNTSFVEKGPGHYVLTANEYANSTAEAKPKTSLHIFSSPFRIVATRKLTVLPEGDQSISQSVGINNALEVEQIIWQTTDQTFSYETNGSIDVIKNVVLNVKKPGPAEYLGFGEQGGKTVLKKPTYLNYFCYDNFNYLKVYGKGALDSREPLYQSSPFYLEMNGTPTYQNVTGVLVDNYSQVAIDLGKNDSNIISIATRFNTFDAYIMTADNVPTMIWQYTSIIGRPKLKPRYILGHHQGCYGYSNEGTVYNVVNAYRGSDIPLDGIHLDVDFQCMLVKDKRYKDGLNNYPPTYWRYDGPNSSGPLAKGVNPTVYGNDYYGQPQRLSFADYPGGEVYVDQYNFDENYNSGYPFHGGVSYGQTLGTPGYYPDLNRADARKVWGEQYQDLFDAGLEFVWQDMTTPAVGRSYGDMLGFPSRLQMTDDSPHGAPKAKTAIELWSLYSYNLHKATFHGLNSLKGRETKRNFIIGRGSQTGMHRFAGLWTGDNGSSWDFWKISVAQVLALGYSGLTIAGVDMGGFTSDPTSNSPYPRWCNPELLIRWYSGAFLLPWYRNHYMQHWDQESNPPAKVFQEPWAFSDVLSNQYAHLIPEDQRVLYAAVVPICRYYVQLRYTLLQVMYDYMFANLINGLPIARAMLITDPLDTNLFNNNEDFIDTQYLLGHNILVCPIVDPQVFNRDIYLPGTDLWYPSNLEVDNGRNLGHDPILKHAADLKEPVQGGRTISYGCSIRATFGNLDNIPFVTPVYIRGGAIIPQIGVRQCIKENDHNPPTIHFYPGGKGKTNYSMYLDDGVSKDSAPINLPQYKYQDKPKKERSAKGIHKEVKMTQETTSTSRTLTICHPWDGFDATPTVGDAYNFAVWTVKNGSSPQVQVSFEDETGKTVTELGLQYNYNAGRGVLTVNIPVALVPSHDSPVHTNGTSNGIANGVTNGSPAKKPLIVVKITGLP
ncbi:glycosyl hydrolases family 31-domain-containing protein [Fusarium venenatum]|uniref:glycosyl hydrolases family 31-domain-containing protein n=1 Tax=Fusarium venenatum TaxID=56646 RepID=UPI001DDE169C|nr:glycosyl hydrolases family 31-domain-containing protein [Fusarium venenatum]